MALKIFELLIFPGLLFLFIMGLIAEYYDRKLYARFQNRVGPPWFQPLADFIKLLGKEDIIPEESDKPIFVWMPLIALTSTVVAFFCIPIWSTQALFSFNGDVIVVLYLLTIPSLSFFLGGWYSRSVYAMIGAIRSLVQLFAYEVPLFLAILAPALLANTWSLSEMAEFYTKYPAFMFINMIGFIVAIISLLGKLEKVPFDIPEAETEMVAGPFIEYSGRLFAFLKTTMNIEMVVASALLAAVFLPWGLQFGPVIGFILFILKMAFIIAIMSLARSLFARMRLDQMIEFCWKYVAPLAFLQVILNLIVKGVFLR